MPMLTGLEVVVDMVGCGAVDGAWLEVDSVFCAWDAIVMVIIVSVYSFYCCSCVVNADVKGCDYDDGWGDKSVTLAGCLRPLICI